jgi:hypothetical protein
MANLLKETISADDGERAAESIQSRASSTGAPPSCRLDSCGGGPTSNVMSVTRELRRRFGGT